MSGLIPFKLSLELAESRPRTGFSASERFHLRGQSTSQLPRFPLPPASKPKRASMPPRPAKRLSFSMPSILPVLPLTSEDWKRAISEVKRHHVNRRYRACFTRCGEILDNIKDTSTVEPAYLISLHFYAATSMEMCARPLAGSSAHRERLFQQARHHYEQADFLIGQAEEQAISRSRPCSFISTSSSLHSPAGSVSSRAWTAETDITSPTPSICSSEDMSSRRRRSQSPFSILSPSPIPARKKVSFELPKDAPVRLEPMIRPDSPTLGFDDEYFTAGLARKELPEIPMQAKSPEPAWAAEEETTLQALKERLLERDSFYSDHDIRDSFLMGSSAARYFAHLMSLKSQVTVHKASLDAVLEAPSCNSGDVLARASAVPISDEMRDISKKARIERLRKNGWQRKRFDPSRYEALREAALADLN